MALPWSYEYKTTINANTEQVLKLKNQLKGTLLHQLDSDNYEEIESEKEQINFTGKNTLFSIASKIQIHWKFKPAFGLHLQFEMTNFIRLLTIVALSIGFLGSLSFRHYLSITFISILILYALYFFILYVWAQKLLRVTLYKIIPEYFDELEIAKREEKYQDKRTPFDQADISKKGNFNVKYDYKNKKKEN